MDKQPTKRRIEKLVWAGVIVTAWNSLYVFSSLPGGAQGMKHVALMAWTVFILAACYMIPYLLFGCLGLLLHVRNVNKYQLATTAMIFVIFATITALAILVAGWLG
jgi:hypothetical protein